MNKEELIALIVSNSYDPRIEEKDESDVVPVWWIKQAFEKAFPPKEKDDNKFYKSSSCDRDERVDMGDVDEY
jgi:hypothetical protein